jgi:hypothetical protein
MRVPFMPEHEAIEEGRKWLDQTLSDPIVALLLENSNLTRKQFESFIISLLGDQFYAKSATKGRKMRVRTDKFEISRGAFNRTLNQARANVIRSIYTLFLLGYVEVFDTPQLGPFLELADNIKAYLEDKKSATIHVGDEEYRKAVHDLSQRLAETIETLAKRAAFSDKL